MENLIAKQMQGALLKLLFTQMVANQTALAALPFAFQNVNTERARQLQVAQQAPTLLQTHQALDQPCGCLLQCPD